MFGWVDFGEDGNIRVENKRENKWEGFWLGRGGGREEKNGGARLFSLRGHQNSISLKLGDNRSENGKQNFGLKCPPYQCLCCFAFFFFYRHFILLNFTDSYVLFS